MQQQEKQLNKKEIAIKVKNVSKKFIIPHEKISSMKSAFANLFKKNSYEEFLALDNVSFEVKKGEFFGIVGRNGSGKSTLLKILAGIYQPDSGEVKINGLISPFLELGIGFNPELSGRDNVYLNATVLGLTEKQIAKKFDEIVKFAELERFIDQKLKNYSSGMQVRLAFSVSIFANRDILLMDEVLAVGDSNFQSKCLEEFNKYRDLGRTVIIVTHDISTVQKYCDRAMLIRYGKMIKIGKADEVVNKYVNDNIEDEERRLSLVKKEKSDKVSEVESDENIERMAEILDVKFLDKNGKDIDVIKTGDSIEFKVFFKIKESFEKNANIGVWIENEVGLNLWGYNTKMDDHQIDFSKNWLSICFPKMNLLKGLYKVNVAIANKETGLPIDVKFNFRKLKVFSVGKEANYSGVFNINHNWK